MKHFWILLIVLSLNVYSQDVNKMFCISDENELGNDNLCEEFLGYDLSSLFVTETHPLGFIGDTYQRFFIHISSVEKDHVSASSYIVHGQTMVKNNICNFQGTIEITRVTTFNEKRRQEINKQSKIHKDAEADKRSRYPVFALLAKYSFLEDRSQQFSGRFKGHLMITFYVKENHILYDNLSSGYSDLYFNSQYSGMWESYDTKIRKVCNWGIERIPCSNDLDIGVSYFSPNEKYLDNGWRSYYDAYVNQNPEALRKEQQKWWIE